MTIIATTKRAQLVHFSSGDAPFILELVNSPGWIQFIGDRGIGTVAQAKDYLQTGPLASYAQHGFGLYLVRRRADGARLGMCGLVKRPSLPHVDIGFAFLPQFTGQGYAIEAATAVLHYANHKLKLAPIVAVTSPENQRSINLLHKLGLNFQEMISLAKEGPELMLFYPIALGRGTYEAAPGQK